MDIAHFMNQRLNFVEFFYSSSTEHFEEMKRKIEVGEEPYVDMRNPEFADEPAFLSEWEDASASVTILGATCLDLVQSTFHAFLSRCMEDMGLKEYVPNLKKITKQNSWFSSYRAFFIEHLEIDWEASGIDVSLLEQMILARNDFTHNPDLTSLNAFQSASHSVRYPDSAFADPRWKELWFSSDHTPLVVPEKTLFEVIASVRTLCEYIDKERYNRQRRAQHRNDPQPSEG